MTRFRLRSIGSKILVRTILVVLLPLVALSTIVLFGLSSLGQTADDQVAESRAQLSQESVAFNAQDQAVSAAREINATLLERVADVTAWTRNPLVIDGAIAGNELAQELGLRSSPISVLEEEYGARKSTGVAPAAERFLLDEIDLAPEFGEVFFTDANGYNAALTNLTSDFVQSDEDWWQDAWANGISVSDVEFDDSAGIFSIDVSARIDDPDSGERLGVMKASLAVGFVQAITTARSIGSTEYTVALTDGRLIAETSTFHDNERLLTSLPDEELPAGLIQAMDEGGAGALVTEETVFGYTHTIDANFLGDEVRGFKGLDWIVLSSQRADVAFSPLRGLQTLSDEIDGAETGLRTTVLVAVLIAAIVAAVIARLLARSIVNPIHRLTTAASDAANKTLPNAVIRIDEAGGDLESVEVPEIELDTGDELERLASSFNSVQGTAVRLAAGQALDRRNTADMFVNLGRRNNSLLKRQLRFIDTLERNEADPDTLESLYKLDHLATRMRRNAESLLVLAGERSPRRWSARVTMRDAVQSALAEVEEYERVDIDQVGPGTLQGNVVADCAHILAELVENALTFSPPHTGVALHGRQNDDGSYTITVSDAGIGMGADELQAANDRLSTTFDLSQVPAQHIGLFVVGRLARQHDIDVSLSASPSGGTTATIVLPSTIASTDGEDAATDGPDTAETPEQADAEHTTQEPEQADTQQAPEHTTQEPEQADTQQAPERTTQEPEQADTEQTAERAGDSEGDQTSEAAQPGASRRADDGPDGVEADGRRGPDDPPSDSVALGAIEVPRRRRSSGPHPAGAARTATSEASKPAGASGPNTVESQGDGAASGDQPTPTEGEPGGDGPTSSSQPDPKLAAYGFKKRRRTAGSDTAETTAGQAATVAKVGGGDDVEATAEQNRSQWSSFQRGKETAESEPSAATESSPDEQGA